MADELEQCQSEALALCNKLISELKRNQEEAGTFFGGEIHKAYVTSTEKAINSTQNIKNRLKKL